MLYQEKLTKLARDRGGMGETWGVSPALKMFIVHLSRIRTLAIGSVGQGPSLVICTLGYFCLSQCTLSGEKLQQGAVIPRTAGSIHSLWG